MKPPHPNSEDDQALLLWAETVDLLTRLPRSWRARATADFADRVRCYFELRHGSGALRPWQIRTLNRLVGFEVIPVPQRTWRFGPDYSAIRIIGSEPGG